MVDDCCTSGDACCAPPPLKFPDAQALRAVTATSCDADAACGCHGGVPRFDGLDPRYKGEEIETVALPGYPQRIRHRAWEIKETNEPVHASFDLSVRFRTALVPTPCRA